MRKVADILWQRFMHSSGEMAATTVARSGWSRRAWWPQIIVLCLLIGFLYREILPRLLQDWWNDPNFSHGFFVPMFASYIAWGSRKELQSARPEPSWFGILVIAFSLGLLVVGVLGAELFLSRCSLVFLLAGLVIHFFGWNHFRLVLFPVAFLLLMIPLPAIIFNQIAFPLQLLAARVSTALLQLAAVPVLREGNIILLPALPLEVAEACSGIRSLVSLGTLAIMYGYLLETKTWRRVALALGAIPIAVLANALRITGTGLVAEYWDPKRAEGFFHEFSGWVIFVLSLAMLFLLHHILRLTDRLSAREAT